MGPHIEWLARADFQPPRGKTVANVAIHVARGLEFFQCHQKPANELELAAQLANLFQHGMPLKEAKSQVQGSTTVEPELLADLCYFITHYAGGDAFPFITFLQTFSALPVCWCHLALNRSLVAFHVKPHMILNLVSIGCSGRNFNIQLQVGHGIFQAMCFTNFKVTGQILPLLRIAMWAAMLCTQKHQDNNQKVLVKGDTDRLKTQANLDKVQLAEEQLQASWKVAQARSEPGQAMKAFGRMCARTILFLVGKQSGPGKPRPTRILLIFWSSSPMT